MTAELKRGSLRAFKGPVRGVSQREQKYYSLVRRASFHSDMGKVVCAFVCACAHLGHTTGLPSPPDSGTATAAGRCRACRPGTSCTRRRTCPANRLGICKEQGEEGFWTECLRLNASELICPPLYLQAEVNETLEWFKCRAYEELRRYLGCCHW